MHSTAEAGRVFQRITYSHGIWLSKGCGGALYQSLHRFVKGYNACAFLSLHKFQYTGFGMTSKYHLLCHEKYDLLKRLQDLPKSSAIWLRDERRCGWETFALKQACINTQHIGTILAVVSH